MGEESMNYLHKDAYLESDDLVEVTLDSQANVMLLDDVNYSAYRSGRSFRYYGGLAEVSPHHIRDIGMWSLTLEVMPGRSVPGSGSSAD
jgi:beta-glucanase (GH16 family)